MVSLAKCAPAPGAVFEELKITPPLDHANGAVFGVLNLGHDPVNVGRTRTWITGRLNATITRPLSITPDTTDKIILCASEVITNAVKHSDAAKSGVPVHVTLIYSLDRIRVEVTDPGSTAGAKPHAENADEFDVNGRGLGIVEVLATKWGHEQVNGGGRLTWFEVTYP